MKFPLPEIGEVIVAETEKVFLRDNTAAKTHQPGRVDAAPGQNDVRLGHRMIQWQVSFLHEQIAVGEHYRQRHIFVGRCDENFACDGRSK